MAQIKPPSSQAKVDRRSVLRGLGAVAAVTLVGGAARAYDQGVFSVGQGPAYAPWRETASGPLGLVGAAILAANPHNTQAWRFRVADTHIDLFDDPRRTLGTIDPFRREMQLGLGGALENLLVTAAARGYPTSVTLLPNPADPTHVARVMLTGGSGANPALTGLHAAIRQRHTNRSAYQERTIPEAALRAMSALSNDPELRLVWLTSSAQHRAFSDLTLRATDDFIADAEFTRDGKGWFRYDWGDIQRERDGVTLDAQSLPPLVAALGKILPAPSADASNNYWRRNTDTHVGTAPVFGIIAVRNHRDPASLLKAGRLYQRLALWGTLEGLATHPLNQPVEMRDRDIVLQREPRYARALAELTGDAWQAVMPFRIGYPSMPGQPSPRRSIQSVLLT